MIHHESQNAVKIVETWHALFLRGGNQMCIYKNVIVLIEVYDLVFTSYKDERIG
jgi:hypothetical protein